MSKVIKFAPGLKPLLKHEGGGHDQSSHGSWANSSERSAKEIEIQQRITQVENKSYPVDEDGMISNRVTAIYETKDGTKIKLLHDNEKTADGDISMSTKAYLFVEGGVKQIADLESSRSHNVFPEVGAIIDRINVQPEYKRQGIATAMLNFARSYSQDGIKIDHSFSLTDDAKGWSAVVKHGSHDQKTHGAWANGSSSDTGLDSMPYEWNPKSKEPLSYKKDLTSEEFEIGKKQLKDIAESPIAIKVEGLKIRSIVEAGGFKSLDEQPATTNPYDIEYREGRYDLEKGLWGLPKDSRSPIYGFLDSPLQPSVHNQTDHYGDVTVILKDSVIGRTTISGGDSANHGLTPVRMTDALKGNLTSEQVDSAYRSRAFQRGLDTVSQPIQSMRTINEIDYFEAQIHGGVKLSDIKSVRLARFSIVDSATIAALEAKGIEVIKANG